MGIRASILLVDDLPESLALLSRIISRHLPEVELRTAQSGAECLRLVQQRQPDVILLDAKMPQMDGFEVCRRLKSDATSLHIPVLMVSGVLTEKRDRIGGMAVGADGYVCKPFEPEELAAQVKALLRVKAAEDALRAHGNWLERQLDSRTISLQESEQRFRALFDNSPDAIFVEGEDGSVLDVNEAACALHGMPRAELVGKRVGDLVPAEERARVEADFKKWFDGSLRHYEGHSAGAGGRTVPVEIRANSFRYGDRKAVVLQVRDVSARHEAERALRHSEARYRAMVQDLTDLVCRRTTDGTLLLANPAFGQFVGRPAAQLAGQSCLPFIPEGERARVLGHLQSLSPQTPVARIEHLMRASDGRLRWVQWIDRGIFDERGQLGEVQSAGRDVTEQKLAQERHSSTTIWLRAVIEIADELIACPDVDTLCLRSVELSRQRLGLDRCRILLERDGQVVGTFGTNFRGETTDEHSDRQPVTPEWRAHFRRRHPEETPWTAARGPLVEWNGWSSVVRHEHEGASAATPIQAAGKAIGLFVNDNGIRGGELDGPKQEIVAVFCSLLGNIIERKSAEAERIRLTTAVDQSAECIIVFSPERYIQYVNPAFTRIFGYKREEAVGRQPTLLYSEMHGEAFFAPIWDQVLGGSAWAGRVTLQNRSGQVVETDQTLSPVRDPSGRIVQCIAVIQDITRAVQMEDQLRQAQKMEVVGRLAGGIAHDFNNLLTGILGFGRLVADQLGPDHALAGDMREILTAGTRAAQLTTRLLAFGRKQMAQPRPLDLNAALQLVDHSLRTALGHDVALVSLPGSGLAAIEADAAQIEQIVMNLAMNARDAMPGGGTLTIETCTADLDLAASATWVGLHPGHYVQLTVRDTGCGMSADAQEHVFEPFFTTKKSGKGLGLSTVYALVQQLKGHIELTTAPGKGTEFRIYIPASATPLPVEAVAATKPAAAPAGGSETILVVEDEAAVRHLVERYLTTLGYRTRTAVDGGEGLRVAGDRVEGIDMVLTDVVMPVMGGPELVERLRAIRPALPAMYMSGFTEEPTTTSLAGPRAGPLLLKPFSFEALAEAVRSTLDAQRKPDGGAQPPGSAIKS